MNQFSLSLTQKHCRPTERLRGEVSWQLNKAPKKLQVNLYWTTAGRGNTDLRIIESKSLKPNQHGFSSFEFVLPAGPYSFSGRLITLSWAVEFIADSNECVTETIVVAPDATELRLP